MVAQDKGKKVQILSHLRLVAHYSEQQLGFAGDSGYKALLRCTTHNLG